jgi:hypothetical protein
MGVIRTIFVAMLILLFFGSTRMLAQGTGNCAAIEEAVNANGGVYIDEYLGEPDLGFQSGLYRFEWWIGPYYDSGLCSR